MMRKRTKFVLCDRHAPWFAGETRARQIECMVEGGPGGWTPGCEGGRCRLWPGIDSFVPEVCEGEYELEWTDPTYGMPEWDVTITATVTKTLRVRAADEEAAITQGHELFTTESGPDEPERYSEDFVRIDRVNEEVPV